MTDEKIKTPITKNFFNFENLEVWQKAHQLTLEIYMVTNLFPQQERFGLISQFRRAASSIAANLAEGNERKSHKEYLQYCYQAKGSLVEAANHLLLARDLDYVKAEDFRCLYEQIINIKKMLAGLISYLKKI